MKKNQQGSTAGIILVAVALIVVIAALGALIYFVFNGPTSKGSPSKTTQATSTTHPTATTTRATPIKPFKDQKSGLSFYFPTQWRISNQNGVITISKVGKSNDTITVKVVNDQKVTDTDSKFGTVSYSYDTTKKVWMETSNGKTTTATTLFTTVGGSPVFAGTLRWKTNIVALSPTQFAIVNITGSGFTAPVDPFTQTIMTTGQTSDKTVLNKAIQDLLASLRTQK